jgi:hypothetical protein
MVPGWQLLYNREMKPVIVFPLHDPQGVVVPHLDALAAGLDGPFARAFLSVTEPTWQRHASALEALRARPFFAASVVPGGLGAGEHFTRLYAWAADESHVDQPLHLCFPDRVAFALQTGHRAAFLADMQNLGANDLPVIFQRSARAWRTHPPTYRRLEQAVTAAGQARFGRALDFAWCHLALRAGDLRGLIPALTRPDISMVAQLVIGLADRVRTRSVDWLAWEDPFIFQRDARGLRREREHSPDETAKRLGYVIPMLQMLS